ncbi:LamG-like jellyroll fold domain-containing protein [uncultured Cyclobacterium sp.]|uniref:LamG-like jellyroll fold domain-containing protein n=1 Tax=uncultured Cyclobacterium sp. TaxID=453820 RepID=UPI0030EE7640|tara:strand:+ start:381479 stop:382366 length:888 start_codon:yes stop_codon:yes gene_type:complete
MKFAQFANFLILVVFLLSCKESDHLTQLQERDGLVAAWGFREEAGQDRMAVGKGEFPLKEMNGNVERVAEGPLSGYSARMEKEVFFSLPHENTGELNIHGKNQGVTVMAWVKWEGKTGFVGGMWNEYTDGGKRQYGLFVDLPHYNGAAQVCGHISYSGGPTPPFPYSCDYAASKQKLTKGKWHYIAFTYDGEYIKAFLDGEFQERAPEPINNTKGFEGLPEGLTHSKNPYLFEDGMGNNGSDFTVGAVVLSRGMGNFFNGLIGGLAVFDRVLEDKEMDEIFQQTMVDNDFVTRED